MVNKNLNIHTVENIFWRQSFSRIGIKPTLTIQVQCLEVMKEERGQESTYLIITQIKAYIMVLLLLLFIFIWSAVTSIMVTTRSLKNRYQILKLYSSAKDNLKIYVNKEYQEVLHVQGTFYHRQPFTRAKFT